MSVFVARLYNGRVLGVFSTQQKAEVAAREFFPSGANLVFEGSEGEIFVSDPGNSTTYDIVHITEWAVDVALVGGEWKAI